MNSTYHFSRKQLDSLLDSTLKMFLEYRDVHGKDESFSQSAAVTEILEGLDADKYLSKNMGESLMLQLPDPQETIDRDAVIISDFRDKAKA